MNKPIHQFFSISALWPLWCAHGVTLALHGQRFSWWYVLLWFAIIYWHTQVIKGRWFLPGRAVKSAIVIASAGLLWLSSHSWLTLEPLVNLLVLSFVLKLLELKRHRDGTIILFLSYFVTACHFLFYQTLLATIFGTLSFLLTTIALIHWQASRFYRISDESHVKLSVASKKTTVVILQAIPLMLILLLMLPRLGTLWSVPLQGDQARVGMSDSMSPGDISRLSQQGGLAFRVAFINKPIPSVDRYWRGLVLTDFDGRRWQRPASIPLLAGSPLVAKEIPTDTSQVDNNDFTYRIMLEATGKDWLYSMLYVQAIDQPVKANVNQELLTEKVDQRMEYRVHSNTKKTHNTLTNLAKKQALDLPNGFDTKARDWAKVLYSKSSSKANFIEQVLQFYRNSFTYTLSPPKLGRNTIDEFLFETQRGFCEHFASSFVVIMRSVGIPARVVVGYQGGKWNEESQYLLVSQNDAHAWAEVWLANKGWVRVDPTAAVAPNRIERGLFDALNSDDQASLDGHYSGTPWLNKMRLKWDNVNYQWQRWVMNFDNQQQTALLKKWFGDVSLTTIIIIAGLAAFFFMSLLSLWYFWRSKAVVDKDKKLYLFYLKCLQKKGVEVDEFSNLTKLTDQAKATLRVKIVHLDRLKSYFEKLFYVNNSQKKTIRQAIRQEIKHL